MQCSGHHQLALVSSDYVTTEGNAVNITLGEDCKLILLFISQEGEQFLSFFTDRYEKGCVFQMNSLSIHVLSSW